MEETGSKLKGTFLAGKLGGEQPSTLRGSLVGRSEIIIPKIETFEGFKKSLHVGRKFSSDNYDYEITRITDAMVATRRFW